MVPYRRGPVGKREMRPVKHLLHAGIALLVLAALFGTLQPATAQEAIAGRWAGTVTEKDVGKYTVYVDIHPGQQTGVVHFLRYPCGGTLSLVSQSGRTYDYRERLTFGQKECTDNLRARITWQAPNLIYFEEIVEGSANVYGTLKRIIDVRP